MSGTRPPAWKSALPWLIAAAATLPFLPALGNEFVKLDDNVNFETNPNYRGLGLPQLRWMFFTFQLGGVYQPLSWLTHGLDYKLWGMWAGGYHLTSILIHAACAASLFHLARRLYRLALPSARDESLDWAAAFAALSFAVHPQRAEVVAWASNRSYVLPALFAILTVDFYVRAQAEPKLRTWWLGCSLAAFAASLASKAIAMTLPAILLVLDAYPLRRWQPGRPDAGVLSALLREKLPFLGLALIAAVVAANGRYSFGAMIPVSQFGWLPRLAQACFGLSNYLEKLILPLHLAPMYTLPFQLHPLDALCLPRTLVVVAAAALTLACIRRAPGLSAAAISHALLLAPFLGLSQYGLKLQLAADKWFHLAAIGWSLAAGGAVAATSPDTLPRLRRALLAVLATLGALSAAQTMRWRDTETLLSHNVRVDPTSYFCHNNLAVTYNDRKDYARALAHALEAVRLHPGYTLARMNAAVSYSMLSEHRQALFHLERALEADPRDPLVHYNLGFVYWALGRKAEAMGATAKSLALNPNQANAHNNLGHYLQAEGKLEEAIVHFQEALRLAPDFQQAANNLRATIKRKTTTGGSRGTPDKGEASEPRGS